jgi:hypothetical protein
MDNQTDKWIAVVYDGLDKVGSRLFTGDEAVVQLEAKTWVNDTFGEKRDWSLHQVQ